MKAVASVTFDDALAVHDVKVIFAREHYFVVMPSRKNPEGTFRDIVHPINAEFRSALEESVTKAMKHFALSLLIPFVFMIAENGILNLSVFLAILAVIIFSYIFSYGAKLQQESDETL